MTDSNVPRIARYTYRLHLLAAVLEGAFAGVIVTSDVVARKALEATPFQLVLLTMLPTATWLVALHAARVVEGADRKRTFLLAGTLGRLPLVAVAFIAGPGAFIALLSLHWIVGLAIIPAQNVLFQRNYPGDMRGRLYSRAMAAHWMALGVVSIATGITMDRMPGAWRLLYPAAALLGLGQCLVLGRIRVRRRREAPRVAAPKGIVALLSETLKTNAGFRRFESALFLYGMGFMCMMPVIPLKFVDEMGMSYAQASLAKGVAFPLMNVLFLGLAGRLHDRIGLERTTGIATTGLMLTALAFAFAPTPELTIAAYGLFGLSMTGIGVAWTLGAVKFAPEGGASRYMSAHMFLVGVRAVFGHPLGGWIAVQTGGTRATFLTAAGFFVAATVLMLRAARLGDAGAAHGGTGAS